MQLMLFQFFYAFPFVLMFKTFEYIYFLYESDLFIVTFFSFSLHCFDLVILVLPYHILKYWCKNDILEETISPNNYIENFFPYSNFYGLRRLCIVM